jgi:hypothetical protein
MNLRFQISEGKRIFCVRLVRRLVRRSFNEGGSPALRDEGECAYAVKENQGSQYEKEQEEKDDLEIHRRDPHSL